MNRWGLIARALPVLLLAACTDTTGGRVSLALTSLPPGSPLPSPSAAGGIAAPAVVAAGDSTVIVLGNDTIVLRSVELVLREVELKLVETPGCDDIPNNDDCEEFETGAMLVSLPLGTTATETVVSVNAPTGQYDELEFELHKPDELSDAAFIAANPAFDGVSIKAVGTYSQGGSRSEFTFISDLNAEQEVFLSPPLTVSDGEPTNVTLRVDIAKWFLNAAGTALVNPASANKGQANEGVVKDRIEASVDAFRDDDHDGHDDHSGR